MRSLQRISANRRNAQRSMGPRTAAGKARSKGNSWRHGLSVIPHAMFPPSAELRQLVSAFAGPNPDPIRLHFATIAAEAELEVLRVQVVRKSRLESKIGDDPTVMKSEQTAEGLASLVLELNRLERYEQRAISRRNRALQLL
jgi:hypothetical protein